VDTLYAAPRSTCQNAPTEELEYDMSPLAALSMSMIPLQPMDAEYAVTSPVSWPDEVAALFSATFVYVESKTKISRNVSGAVPLPTMRT